MACASQPTIVVWEKPGAGPEEVEAARAACLAELETPSGPGATRTRFQADETGACFVHCMRDRGFTWRTEKAGASSGATDQAPESPPLAPPSSVPSGSDTSGCPLPPAEGGEGS